MQWFSFEKSMRFFSVLFILTPKINLANYNKKHLIMTYSILIICITRISIILIYWIMPTKKMKKVNREIIKQKQILSISKILKIIKRFQ